jgi:hypothetical protein
LRLGFSYQLTPNVGLLSDTTGKSGFSAANNVVTSIDGFRPTTYFDNPFPTGLVYPSGSSVGPATLLGQTISFIQRDGPNPYSVQWNFDIQRELPGGIVLDVAYVGNRGIKLESGRTWDQLPDSALALGGQLLT